MTNFVFNISKGRLAEFYYRVKNNDPANSALVLIALDATGLESQANLEDSDTFAEVVDGTTNEATNTDYSRKVYTDADLVALAPNDTDNRMDLDVPDHTFVGVDAGNAWGALVLCYDNDTTSGDNTNLIPMTHHDFAVTPDGNDIVARFPNGFLRAS